MLDDNRRKVCHEPQAIPSFAIMRWVPESKSWYEACLIWKDLFLLSRNRKPWQAFCTYYPARVLAWLDLTTFNAAEQIIQRIHHHKADIFPCAHFCFFSFDTEAFLHTRCLYREVLQQDCIVRFFTKKSINTTEIMQSKTKMIVPLWSQDGVMHFTCPCAFFVLLFFTDPT